MIAETKTVSIRYAHKVLEGSNIEEAKQLIRDLLDDREWNLKQIELLEQKIDQLNTIDDQKA